jgi:hypothetical protein
MLSVAHTWTLTAIAIAFGIATLWSFQRFSNQEQVALAKRKVWAHLYAFRLYADEPALIFRAQKQLLLWNARYLALMLRPTLVVFVPVTLLLFGLDALYGRRPLEPGEAANVTAQFSDGVDVYTLAPTLEGSQVAVETPSVRIPNLRQVSWRVRAMSAASGSVILRIAGTSLSKTVHTGSAFCFVSERRVASLLDWLRYPGESRLPSRSLRWISVDYPAATIDIFGFGAHWLLWFLAVSLLTMLLAKKRFGVTF